MFVHVGMVCVRVCVCVWTYVTVARAFLEPLTEMVRLSAHGLDTSDQALYMINALTAMQVRLHIPPPSSSIPFFHSPFPFFRLFISCRLFPFRFSFSLFLSLFLSLSLSLSLSPFVAELVSGCAE